MLPHNIVLAVFSCLLAQGNVVQALPLRPYQTRSERLLSDNIKRRDLDAAPQLRPLNILRTRGWGEVGIPAGVAFGISAAFLAYLKRQKIIDATIRTKGITMEAAKRICNSALEWTGWKADDKKKFEEAARSNPIGLVEVLVERLPETPGQRLSADNEHLPAGNEHNPSGSSRQEASPTWPPPPRSRASSLTSSPDSSSDRPSTSSTVPTVHSA